VITAGSGRPVNVTVIGDASQDDNSNNDRLPGASRNSFVGPNYSSTDMRLSRKLYAKMAGASNSLPSSSTCSTV